MGLKVYIDGGFYDKEQAKVSVFDHGLLYGDGVFEGIRSYNGVVFKLDEHIERLYESAHSLMLPVPMTPEQMKQAVVRTLQENKLLDAYIRLVITRGVGDLGLDPRKCSKSTMIIIADKIVLYPQELYRDGMAIITVPTVRNVSEAVNPQIKSLNYLNNIMAKIEAANAGCQEAIMLNSFGFVAECTGDNIFLIKNKIVYTPPQHMGILRGITREVVLTLARQEQYTVREQVFTRHEVFNADELFLTGTAAEIIPVVKVDGRVIGSGKPGPVTQRLLAAFQQVTSTQGTRYRLD